MKISNTDYIQFQNPLNKKWLIIDCSLGIILKVSKRKNKNIQEYIKKEN